MDRRRFLIRGIAALIVLSAVVGVGLVWSGRMGGLTSSAVVTGPWSDIDGLPWLLPDLQDAKVILPDRPHRPPPPGAQLRSVEPSLLRTRSFLLRTNSQRLRGPAVQTKVPETYRIIALGESVTLGWGVEESETYPARLEAKLREEGLQVEVLNAGVPGSNPHTMARWCEKKAAALSPDLILWTSRRVDRGGAGAQGYADAVSRCRRARNWGLAIVLPPLSGFDLKGLANEEAERAQLSAALGPAAPPVWDLAPAFLAAEAGKGETLVSEAGKVRVLDQESGHVWLEATATAEGLPNAVYDLFEAEPDVREALFFDDGHPNAEGFIVFADLLVEPVSELLRGGAKTGG